MRCPGEALVTTGVLATRNRTVKALPPVVDPLEDVLLCPLATRNRTVKALPHALSGGGVGDDRGARNAKPDREGTAAGRRGSMTTRRPTRNAKPDREGTAATAVTRK